MKGLRNFFFLAITSAVAVLAFFACINTKAVGTAKKHDYTSSQQAVQEYHNPQYAIPSSDKESSNDKAQSAAAELEKLCPGAEVQVLEGAQPLYPLIITLE